VPTVKLLEHSIAELEELGLTILLPFYVLKLRHEVARARKSESRARYAAQMREIVIELEEAVARGTKTQGLNASDTRVVLEHIDELLVSLYGEYEEFEEVSGMIAGTLLSTSERAEKRATAERDKFWKKKLDEERAELQKVEAERQKAVAEQKKAETEQKRAEAERQKARAEQKKAKAEQKKADIKRVRNLLAKGWQYAEIAETLELDVKTVRLYAGSI
jgi:DNA-binding NarL/FixJ family response regulator